MACLLYFDYLRSKQKIVDEEGKWNMFYLMYIGLVSLINSPSCSYVFLYRYVRNAADEIILQGGIGLSVLCGLCCSSQLFLSGKKTCSKNID